MVSRKKRPMVDWLRWARKPFLYIFYSLGAGLFFALEKLEELLGGKALKATQRPAARNLSITFTADEEDADLVLPFVPLFSNDNRWIKLAYERILRELRRDRHSIRLPGRSYGKGISEGPYTLGAFVLLASQKEVALFLRGLSDEGYSFQITSALATRRTGGIPHPKGLLLRMAVGSRRIELTLARGGDGILGVRPEEVIRYLDMGVEYHHLFLASTMADTEKCFELIDSRVKEGMKLSLYAALSISFSTLIPIFLIEPPEEKKQMEDAALLLVEWPAVEKPSGT